MGRVRTQKRIIEDGQGTDKAACPPKSRQEILAGDRAHRLWIDRKWSCTDGKSCKIGVQGKKIRVARDEGPGPRQRTAIRQIRQPG